jgi:arsenate reductase (thioredoxin)
VPTSPARVLFVCIGNAIRSQMAEAFARKYGSDVIAPTSAGLFPNTTVLPLTHKVMADRNIGLDGHFPKGLDEVDLASCDLIVNISGQRFPIAVTCPIHEWRVADPIGKKEPAYEQAAHELETLVMQLILELRNPRRR